MRCDRELVEREKGSVVRKISSVLGVVVLVGVLTGGAAEARSQGALVQNYALGKATIASAALPEGQPSLAVDGHFNTYWNAGNFPIQWIEVDLGATFTVGGLSLAITQLPDGFTSHRVTARETVDGPSVLLHQFTGQTTDTQVLSVELLPAAQAVRFVRVETTASPSWVAWREIQVCPATCPRTLSVSTNTVLSGDHYGPIEIAVDGITLDCAGHTIWGPGEIGVDLRGRNDVTVKNCTATGFDHGFFLANSSRNILLGNVAHDNLAHGFVLVEGSAGNVLDENDSRANDGFGFVLNDSPANVLRSNRAESNTLQGFVIAGSHRNRLEANMSEANGGWNGFEIGGSNDTVLTGNAAVGNAFGHGFAIYLSTRVLAQGNVARDNSASGILLDTVESSELTANEVTANSGGGIVVLASTNIGIVANRMTRNGATALVLFGTNDSYVSDNTMNDNPDQGIELTGSNNNSVVRNDVRGQTGSGLRIVDASGNSVADNLVVDNFWGILLSNAKSNLVTGNTVTHSTEHGVLLLDDSTANVVERNVVVESGLVGFLTIAGRDNTLSANIANQNGDEGFVFTAGSTGNIVDSNRSMMNRVGFSLQAGATGNTLTHNVAQANSSSDAEESNPAGANTWMMNRFGTTAGF
jgi:parallel beta-helix repeat protein